MGSENMKAYKTFSTITDSKQVILSDVPFRAGEKVEIVVRGAEADNGKKHLGELKALFNETQSQSQIQTLTEDDIVREIEAHRNGK